MQKAALRMLAVNSRTVHHEKNVSIHIEYITLDAFDGIHVTITVQCSKGTYVRSLARDIAEQLGTVGYVTALRRISSGEFSVEDAVNIREFEQAMHVMQAEEFQSLDVTAE